MPSTETYTTAKQSEPNQAADIDHDARPCPAGCGNTVVTGTDKGNGQAFRVCAVCWWPNELLSIG